MAINADAEYTRFRLKEPPSFDNNETMTKMMKWMTNQFMETKLRILQTTGTLTPRHRLVILIREWMLLAYGNITHQCLKDAAAFSAIHALAIHRMIDVRVICTAVMLGLPREHDTVSDACVAVGKSHGEWKGNRTAAEIEADIVAMAAAVVTPDRSGYDRPDGYVVKSHERGIRLMQDLESSAKAKYIVSLAVAEIRPKEVITHMGTLDLIYDKLYGGLANLIKSDDNKPIPVHLAYQCMMDALYDNYLSHSHTSNMNQMLYGLAVTQVPQAMIAIQQMFILFIPSFYRKLHFRCR